MPRIIQIQAVDGYPLHAKLWTDSKAEPLQPVVIINCATSVQCRYYDRFAQAMHAHSFTVLTYDYRGIGNSKHGSLRALDAGWLDWGESDFEGVLQYVHSKFADRPIYVVGHSVGGFLIGLAPSAGLVSKIFTMGAQYAYWRDYARASRAKMYIQWHITMPVIARVLGFVPAQRLGWMEDTPKGVALDWAGMGPRFELSLANRKAVAPSQALTDRFRQVTAPILALGIDDDPFGTPAALDRLLGYYSASERFHLRLNPQAFGYEQIGHFAFFNKRFSESLWPIALNWLLGRDMQMASLGLMTRYGASV